MINELIRLWISASDEARTEFLHFIGQETDTACPVIIGQTGNKKAKMQAINGKKMACRDGRSRNPGRGRRLSHVQMLIRLPAEMRERIETWGQRRNIWSGPQAAIAMVTEILENEKERPGAFDIGAKVRVLFDGKPSKKIYIVQAFGPGEPSPGPGWYAVSDDLCVHQDDMVRL
jgi:hypothetical protein